MKKYNLMLIIISLAITNISIEAQLLNSSFENWDALGNPVNWITSNLPGIEKTISQSNDAQEGNSSVRIDVIDIEGEAFPGSLQSLDDTYQFGHPITERHESLNGYYKFSPQSSSILILTVSIYGDEFSLIGVGGMSIENSSDAWVQFSIPITYLSSSDAESVVVSVSISDTADIGFNPDIVGSSALIDNISFQNPTDVELNEVMLDLVTLNQNYPNPFNPSTKIEYTIPKSEVGGRRSELVNLTIYDLLGRKVTTIVNEKQKSGNYEVEFDGSELTNGIYFYRLRAGDIIRTKRMILLK